MRSLFLVQFLGELSVSIPVPCSRHSKFHQQSISGQMCFLGPAVAILAVVLQYSYGRVLRPISDSKATPTSTKPRLYGWYAKSTVVVKTFVLPGTIP